MKTSTRCLLAVAGLTFGCVASVIGDQGARNALVGLMAFLYLVAWIGGWGIWIQDRSEEELP